MEKLYSIGQISKLCGLPIKTLRYYDEIDLFKPDVVNNFTGYRYYSIEQFWNIQAIIRSKALGYNLKEIKEILKDQKSLISSLKEQRKKAISEIEKLKSIVKIIDNNVKQLEYFDKISGTTGIYNSKHESMDALVAYKDKKNDIKYLDAKLIDMMSKYKSGETSNVYGYFLDKQSLINGKIELVASFVQVLNSKSEDKKMITKIIAGDYKCCQNKILVDDKFYFGNSVNVDTEYVVATEIFSCYTSWKEAYYEIRMAKI